MNNHYCLYLVATGELISLLSPVVILTPDKINVLTSD